MTRNKTLFFIWPKSVEVGLLPPHIIDLITITGLEMTAAVNEVVKQPIKQRNKSLL